MARYVNENGGSIEAHQWFRNGDHPGDLVGMLVDDPMGGKYEKIEGAVVQFFQHPDHDGEDRCNNCGRKWSDHGWIDQGPDGITVCPGDYIHDLDYIHVRIGRADFESIFKLDMEELERRILALLPPLERKPDYPDFGYMPPQSEVAYDSVQYMRDQAIDRLTNGADTFEFEKYTVCPREGHLPDADYLCQIAEEHACENEATECVEYGRSPSVLALAAALLGRMSDEGSGWMTGELVSTHTVTLEGDQLLLDRRFWGAPIQEALVRGGPVTREMRTLSVKRMVDGELVDVEIPTAHDRDGGR